MSFSEKSVKHTQSTEDMVNLPKPVLSQTQKSRKNQIIDLSYIGLNTIATIVVVFLNKVVFSDPQLRRCQLTHAIFHFVMTFCILYITTLRPFELFTVVRLPLTQLLPICSLFAGFLILNNLSLTFNSVGFYQLAKILTTPAVVFFSWAIFNNKISRRKLAAVICTCVGVAMTSSIAVTSNPFGATLAVAAFSVTALYQIWIGKTLQDRDLSAPQLLLNQTFMSSILILPLVPFMDEFPVIRSIPPRSAAAFVASGFVAALINLSQFLIIGRTSALTFNVALQIKMAAILAIGWAVEGKEFTIVDISGIALALGGAWMYAQITN